MSILFQETFDLIDLSSAGNLTVTAGTSTITRASGSWSGDGVKVGDVLTLSGFSNGGNNGSFTVATVGTTTLTLTGMTGVNEGPVSATASVADTTAAHGWAGDSVPIISGGYAYKATSGDAEFKRAVPGAHLANQIVFKFLCQDDHAVWDTYYLYKMKDDANCRIVLIYRESNSANTIVEHWYRVAGVDGTSSGDSQTKYTTGDLVTITIDINTTDGSDVVTITAPGKATYNLTGGTTLADAGSDYNMVGVYKAIFDGGADRQLDEITIDGPAASAPTLSTATLVDSTHITFTGNANGESCNASINTSSVTSAVAVSHTLSALTVSNGTGTFTGTMTLASAIAARMGMRLWCRTRRWR